MRVALAVALVSVSLVRVARAEGAATAPEWGPLAVKALEAKDLAAFEKLCAPEWAHPADAALPAAGKLFGQLTAESIEVHLASTESAGDRGAACLDFGSKARRLEDRLYFLLEKRGSVFVATSQTRDRRSILKHLGTAPRDDAAAFGAASAEEVQQAITDAFTKGDELAFRRVCARDAWLPSGEALHAEAMHGSPRLTLDAPELTVEGDRAWLTLDQAEKTLGGEVRHRLIGFLLVSREGRWLVESISDRLDARTPHLAKVTAPKTFDDWAAELLVRVNAQDKLAFRDLCAPELWAAERDSGERFVQQMIRKKITLGAPVVDECPDRALVRVVLTRDGKPVGAVWFLAKTTPAGPRGTLITESRDTVASLLADQPRAGKVGAASPEEWATELGKAFAAKDDGAILRLSSREFWYRSAERQLAKLRDRQRAFKEAQAKPAEGGAATVRVVFAEEGEPGHGVLFRLTKIGERWFGEKAEDAADEGR